VYHLAGALQLRACRSAPSLPCCLREALAALADASAILPPFRPPAPTGTNATIIDSVAINFDVLGSDWQLEAIPLEGWDPVWLEPLYLVVVIVALLASASALLILKARWQHYHLLLRMLPKRVRGRLACGTAYRLLGSAAAASPFLCAPSSASPGRRAFSQLAVPFHHRSRRSTNPSASDTHIENCPKRPHSHPKQVISRLHAQGGLIVERFESVTILFSDIVEYTSLAARLEPEQIVVMLNHVYSIYDTICQEEGVFKVETIGDGFMAVGGAPEKCEPLEAAERVARVALRMMQVRCVRAPGSLRTAPASSHALVSSQVCACFLPCIAEEL